MDSAPLVMEMDTDLYELSRLIAASDLHHRHEGFILTEQGCYTGIGTSYDLVHTITERAQAQLYHLAHYDSLTGLPNRLLFMDRLAQAMAQADRDERLVAIMLLDLDRFKAINDTFGHSVGDLLLKHIAERLSGAMRTSDTIARLGGDEFTAMLPSARYIHDSATVAEKILGLFTAPFVMKGHEISLTR
jgi:diguanylate cyclase (GGDEF)-like protein